MKIAIMKGGANITFSANNKSAANADILYALRTIDPSKHQCTVVTHRTRNTLIPKPLSFLELQTTTSLDQFDVILMFNFSVNFFGGAEDKNLVHMYRLMAKTETPICYVNTDGQLNFKQLWPSIMKREWAQNYSEEEFHIEPNKVTYLTQGRSYEKVMKGIKSKLDFIVPNTVAHFPWERTILAKHEKYFAKPTKPFVDRPFDLVFGGATRNTHKRKRIEHYYQGHLQDTLLFGNLRGVATGRATVQAKCSYQEFIRKMQQGVATVTIADQGYNDNFFTLRMYEAILAGCLVFIDNQMDTGHSFYSRVKTDTEGLYVKNATDVQEMFIHYPVSELEKLTAVIKKEILDAYDVDSENKRLIDLLHSAASHRN